MSTTPFSLDLVIADLPGVPDKQLKALKKLKIATLGDVVAHYPRRYEDRREFDQWPMAALDEAVCIHGVVTDTQTKRFGGGPRQSYYEVAFEPEEDIALAQPIYLRWFGMSFMRNVIAAGHELVIYGQPKAMKGRLVISHPDYEIIEPGGDSAAHMGRITPIYPATSGLQQRFLRSWAYRAISRLDELAETETHSPIDTVLPTSALDAIDPGFAPPDRLWALKQVHFPDSMADMERAREYLALEEFVAMQIQILRRKQAIEAELGEPHCGEGHLFNDFLELLPFDLTGAQKRTIGEIRADMEAHRPMNRLLQGDVGAGKTMVAFAAMLFAVEAGFQAAMMAPTQILAEQHFLGFQKFAQKLDLKISLRTGSKSDANFAGGELFGEARPDIIVGTHALIHDKVKFENLGLVVVDEQHKFGVAQRSKLAAQGSNPDVLVMTATPIPRTLTMTAYGDLDVSILDELPANRGEIITGVRETTKTQQAASFLMQHLDAGRQAYIVYPLVEQSDKLKSQAATVEFEAWQRRLSKYNCALLHGKIPPEEKESIMADFRDGKTDVLVATTVIEVGVDVPNANIMLIYSAERFGLAQLHQLRGRVGRGEHKSYCVLMVDPKNAEAKERLKIMEQTRDGFKIAEEDLKIRGPGDILGTKQAGLPDLRFAEKLGDAKFVQKSRDIAQHILDHDSELASPENWPLRAVIQSAKFEKAAQNA
tara:strand:- start:9098 stop:11224 length:2127 start_codon:yes stop_codon:yes gene_type:complete